MLLIENDNYCVSDVRSVFFTMNFACRVRIGVSIALRSRFHQQLVTKQNCELNTTFWRKQSLEQVWVVVPNAKIQSAEFSFYNSATVAANFNY